MAKPRARRSDEAAASAEEFDEAGVRVHGLKAVQQKHRPAGAAPHNLQFDPAHLEPLRSVNHHHIPSFRQVPCERCIALTVARPKPVSATTLSSRRRPGPIVGMDTGLRRCDEYTETGIADPEARCGICRRTE